MVWGRGWEKHMLKLEQLLKLTVKTDSSIGLGPVKHLGRSDKTLNLRCLTEFSISRWMFAMNFQRFLEQPFFKH